MECIYLKVNVIIVQVNVQLNVEQQQDCVMVVMEDMDLMKMQLIHVFHVLLDIIQKVKRIHVLNVKQEHIQKNKHQVVQNVQLESIAV